ncbi:MAG: DUF58 domain-containing protein [Victivallales bacterium]|nr:DUF58 domain-containing protein [Victivallales bacterium]MBT7301103.1 DUF58 domain-containing protein [Victivallales bacterium]
MPEPKLTELLSPSVLARIDDYSLLARTVVEGFISGLHRSLFQGFGSEFFQYRPYVAGDDLKYVDWKVYARQDRLQTKVFQEETNMNCCLVLDASASMDYQGDRAACNKLRYAAMAAACLAYLASRQGDRVGLYAYGDGLQTVVHPGRGGGLRGVLSAIARLKPAGVADHRQALDFVSDSVRRRGIVVWLSDFHGAEDEVGSLLKRFRFSHHEGVAFQILDPDELDLPFAGTMRFVDSEHSGEIVTAPEEVREEYRQRVAEFTETIRLSCLREQVDYLFMRSDENLGNLLAAYLHRRESLA